MALSLLGVFIVTVILTIVVYAVGRVTLGE